MTHFQDLGLSAPVLKALAAEGYTVPTPIQAQAIPIVLQGRDVVGLAQTGTGKTAAFALPIIDRLVADKKFAPARGARVLVLAPTRELAAQIEASFAAYGKFSRLTHTTAFGGVPIGRQIRALERGVDVLVATPGRLLDLIEQRKCRLDSVEILVLDEADHMLDLGFIHALKRIAKLVPTQRQTVFFSATMPPPIAELAKNFLNDPVQVAVTPVSSTAQRVEQAVIHVEQSKKQALLEDIVRDPRIARALVFTRTKHGADRVVQKLEQAGIEAEAIHGNKSQSQRERALKAFKGGRTRLLVATEIAARGIDVDDVTHVINFDLPDVPEQYVHRIGRTARAGACGEAISFCAPDERASLKGIERLTKQAVPVQEHPLSLATPSADALAAARKRPNGGGRSQQQQQRPSSQQPRKPRPKSAPGDGAARDGASREGSSRDASTRSGAPPRARRGGDDVWSNHSDAPRTRRR